MPTIIVLFGATGDLMQRKIMPALFNLFEKEKLPKLIKIIGFSRPPYSNSDFRGHITEILKQHKLITKDNEEQKQLFLDLFSYQQGLFEKKSDYKNIAQSIGATLNGQDLYKCCKGLDRLTADRLA